MTTSLISFIYYTTSTLLRLLGLLLNLNWSVKTTSRISLVITGADKPLRNAIDITNYFNTKITQISKEVGLFPCGFEALKLAQISTLNQQYSALGFHDVNKKYVITVIEPLKIKNQQDRMNYMLI